MGCGRGREGGEPQSRASDPGVGAHPGPPGSRSATQGPAPCAAARSPRPGPPPHLAPHFPSPAPAPAAEAPRLAGVPARLRAEAGRRAGHRRPRAPPPCAPCAPHRVPVWGPGAPGSGEGGRGQCSRCPAPPRGSGRGSRQPAPRPAPGRPPDRSPSPGAPGPPASPGAEVGQGAALRGRGAGRAGAGVRCAPRAPRSWQRGRRRRGRGWAGGRGPPPGPGPAASPAMELLLWAAAAARRRAGSHPGLRLPGPAARRPPEPAEPPSGCGGPAAPLTGGSPGPRLASAPLGSGALTYQPSGRPRALQRPPARRPRPQSPAFPNNLQSLGTGPGRTSHALRAPGCPHLFLAPFLCSSLLSPSLFPLLISCNRSCIASERFPANCPHPSDKALPPPPPATQRHSLIHTRPETYLLSTGCKVKPHLTLLPKPIVLPFRRFAVSLGWWWWAPSPWGAPSGPDSRRSLCTIYFVVHHLIPMN